MSDLVERDSRYEKVSYVLDYNIDDDLYIYRLSMTTRELYLWTQAPMKAEVRRLFKAAGYLDNAERFIWDELVIRFDRVLLDHGLRKGDEV